MKRNLPILILVILLLAGAVYYATTRQPGSIVLTGIVTTDQVIASSQMQGRLQELLVKEGDAVTNGQLLAVIQPEEQAANLAFFNSSQQQYTAQVVQAKASLENARLNFEREKDLHAKNIDSAADYDQARTAYEAAQAFVDSLDRQAQAADSQIDKAKIQLGYTEIRSPVDAIVDTRAALQGEVVNPGQAIVTLINQDDLWVRADVEETYVDRIHLGDKLPVKLPSGAMREGTVFYRGVDADYATQRDVSRTKRDIKTFEIRLRCDNHDRSLAVGMTAYVTLPFAKQ